MYIKFIKRHVVGIAKGEVRNLQERQAQKMIIEKYAEEIDKEEYDELREGMIEVLRNKQSVIDKEAQEKITKEREDIAKRLVETNKTGIVKMSGVKKETPEDTRVFHEVTKEDLENNPDFVSRHVKVGDEILLDEDANPIRSSDDGSYYGREGKIVGKPQPSSED